MRHWRGRDRPAVLAGVFDAILVSAEMTQKLVGRGNLVVHADMSSARVAGPAIRRRTLGREGSDGRSLLACDLARIETDLSVRIDDQVIGNIGTHDGPQLLDHLDRGDSGPIRQFSRAAVYL